MRKTVLLIALLIINSCLARSYVYDVLDVNITVLDNGDLSVVEEWVLTFNGTYNELFRSFYNEVTNFKVTSSSVSVPVTYSNGEHVWKGPWTDTTKSYILSYIIHDAFSIKPGNDSLFSTLIFKDRDALVKSSACIVSFPGGVNELSYRTSYGTVTKSESDKFIVTAVNLPANVPLDFEIVIPKGVITPQASFKNWVSMNADLLNFLFMIPLFLSLILPGRSIKNYLRLRKEKTEAEESSVDEHVRIEDLRPAVAGFIYDLSTSPNEVIATIIDLAVKEYIYIEKIEKQLWFDSTFLIKMKTDYSRLNDYEKWLMRLLFGTSDKINLNDLRKKFYPVTYTGTSRYGLLDSVLEMIHDEASKQGLLVKEFKKAKTDNTLSMVLPAGIGFVGLFFYGFVIMILANSNVVHVALWGSFMFICMLTTGVMGGLVRKVIALTGKGEGATKTYKELRKFIKESPLTEGRLFDEYLPYAIALGVQKEWVKKGEALEYKSTWHSSNFHTASIIGFTNAMNTSMSPASSSGGGGFGGGGGAGGGGGGAR